MAAIYCRQGSSCKREYRWCVCCTAIASPNFLTYLNMLFEFSALLRYNADIDPLHSCQVHKYRH